MDGLLPFLKLTINTGVIWTSDQTGLVGQGVNQTALTGPSPRSFGTGPKKKGSFSLSPYSAVAAGRGSGSSDLRCEKDEARAQRAAQTGRRGLPPLSPRRPSQTEGVTHLRVLIATPFYLNALKLNSRLPATQTVLGQ